MLITGASSGIGRELAILHAQNDGDVVIVARRQERLEALKQEIEETYKRTVMIIVKDLSNPDAPQEIYNELHAANVEVEYLVNNAGFGGRGKFFERPWADDRAMIEVNIIALTALCRLFIPGFVDRNRGKILNVSSTASLAPGPLQAVYFATKAYVTSLSNALAEELHDTNVTVTALLPGATATEFEEKADMQQTHLFDNAVPAAGVASAGYEAMMNGRLNVISGLPWYLRLATKFFSLLPTRLIMRQIRKRQELEL